MRAARSSTATRLPRFPASMAHMSPAAPPPKLDIRGMRLDEAMSNLEHYLDQAYRSGALAEVVIVHGLGTGALREGTRTLLREIPYIKEYRDGGPGQGGTGATLIDKSNVDGFMAARNSAAPKK